MRLVLGETDLGTVSPKLAAQLVRPEEAQTVTVGSNRELAWFCNGTKTVPHPRREWSMAVKYRNQGRGCGTCSGHAVLVGFNDLATVSPKLAAQLVRPEEAQTVTVGSGRELAWFCNGTKTVPHPRREWSAPVTSRTDGRGCGACSGHAVLVGFNDLATLRPDLAVQLVRPEEAQTVTVGSGRELAWFCNGTKTVPHPRREWNVAVKFRNRSRGCGVCSGYTVLVGFNDLATIRPDLASQLVRPEEAQTVTVGSNRELAWFCNGTKTAPHPRREWNAGVDHRANRGCSVCSGHAVLVGFNDLATLRPDLAIQLVNPNDALTVTVSSDRMLAWFCNGTESAPHPVWKWEREVQYRSGGKGCSVCSGRAVLVGFNDLATLRPDLAAQLVRPEEAQTVTVGSNRELAWFCNGTESAPHPRREWDAMVVYRSRSSSQSKACSTCAKHGFDPEKPACLYRFTFRDGGESVQVFGITGDFKNRLQRYKGQITNLTNIESIWFEIGADARRFEAQIITELAASSATPSNIGVVGTARESFCIDEDGWEFITVFEALWSAAKTCADS